MNGAGRRKEHAGQAEEAEALSERRVHAVFEGAFNIATRVAADKKMGLYASEEGCHSSK